MYQEKLGAVRQGSKHALSRSDRYTLEPLHQGPEVLVESGVDAVRAAVLIRGHDCLAERRGDESEKG